MNENLESMIRSPAMKMANEARTRLDSLSYVTGALADLSNVLNDLDPVRTLTENMANQDLLSQLSKTFPQNKLVAYDSIAEMIKSLTESNSLNTRLFESVELNKAFKNAFEATHLGLKPQTQFVLPKIIISESQLGDFSSIISKATEVFKEYNQFSELESFKAISRLKNFPFEDVVPIDFTNFYDTEESDEEDFFKMDSKISSELLSVENFEDLSNEVKISLLFIVKNNYLKTIYYLVFYICMNMIINEGFSVDESFTLNDLEKMIHLVYEEFGNGIIASLLAGYIAKADNEK